MNSNTSNQHTTIAKTYPAIKDNTLAELKKHRWIRTSIKGQGNIEEISGGIKVLKKMACNSRY